MPLDPIIAGGFRGIELQNPLEAYGRVAQFQHLQQQNQLAALQAEEYKRGLAEQEGVRNYLARVAPEKMYAPETLLGLQQYGKTGLGVAQNLTASQKAQAELEKVKVDTEAHRFNLAKSRAEQYSNLLAAAPDRETAIGLLQRQASDPALANTPAAQIPLMEQAKRIPEDPAAFATWKQQQAMGMARWFEANKPQVTARTRGPIAEIVLTNPLTGETKVSAGSQAQVGLTEAQRLQDLRERQRIGIEGQRLGLEGRRVAVLEEGQRRAADPVFQQQMAGAKATGEAIAKGDVAAQQALPKVLNRAEEGLRLIDQMVGKQELRDKSGKLIQEATAPHPGFEPAVGMGSFGTLGIPGIAQYVPGTDAADFKARFDQLKGASFLEAFETLKGAGAISEKEGAKATDAINRMSLAQSEKEFITAARDLQGVIRSGVALAKQKAGAAAPRTTTGGVKFLGFE